MKKAYYENAQSSVQSNLLAKWDATLWIKFQDIMIQRININTWLTGFSKRVVICEELLLNTYCQNMTAEAKKAAKNENDVY